VRRWLVRDGGQSGSRRSSVRLIAALRMASLASRDRRCWAVSCTSNLAYRFTRCCFTAASLTTSSAAISRTVAGSVNRSRSSSGRHRTASTSRSRGVSEGGPSSTEVAVRPTSAELRNNSRVRPTRISSPCRSRCDVQMRSPLTNVPFEDPRSVTHHPGGNRSRTAWRRLTVGSPPSATSLLGSLPTVIRSPASVTWVRPDSDHTSTEAAKASSAGIALIVRAAVAT
jgi:hypothetical protein